MTVTVYTKANCQPCKATVRYLTERGIVFEEKDTGDPANLAAAKALGYSGAPVVVFSSGRGVPPAHWYGFRPDLLSVLARASVG